MADKILALVEESLDDDQANDVKVIPLAGKTDIAEYMVVASGRSARHVGLRHRASVPARGAGLLRSRETMGIGHCRAQRGRSIVGLAALPKSSIQPN
jgi:ribosome-associated protein